MAHMRINSRTALQCTELLNKEASPAIYNPALKAASDAFAEILKTAGQQHEQAVLAAVSATALSIVRVPRSEVPEEARAAATFAALQNLDIDVIVHAALGPALQLLLKPASEPAAIDGFLLVSEPDLLVRARNAAGDPLGWWPVDIKSHTSPDGTRGVVTRQGSSAAPHPESAIPCPGKLERDDAVQLAHYSTHLSALGLAADEPWGGIIGRDPGTIIWQRLDEVAYGRGPSAESALVQYRRRIDERTGVMSAAKLRNDAPNRPSPTAPQVYPDQKFGCKGCEWWPACEGELVAVGGTGHVTLIAGITPDERLKHIPDVTSIGQLETIDVDGDKKRAELKRRAIAYTSMSAIKLDETYEMPSFDIEIDIDLESSQAALVDEGLDAVGADVVYLFGWLKNEVVDGVGWQEAPTGAFFDYSNTLEGELKVLLETWNFLQAEVSLAAAAGKTIGIFHFHIPEPNAFRMLAQRYAAREGVPSPAEVDDFIDRYFVDMLPRVKRLAFPRSAKSPVGSYSIKTLAPVAGFCWELDDAGGAASLLKYAEAISQSDTAGTSCEPCAPMHKSVDCAPTCARCWLCIYNEDDVRATAALRSWLRQPGAVTHAEA